MILKKINNYNCFSLNIGLVLKIDIFCTSFNIIKLKMKRKLKDADLCPSGTVEENMKKILKMCLCGLTLPQPRSAHKYCSKLGLIAIKSKKKETQKKPPLPLI